MVTESQLIDSTCAVIDGDNTSRNTLEEAVKCYFRSIDNAGRVEAKIARSFNQKLCSASLGERQRVFDSLDTVVGPFESLPEEAQRALRRVVFEDDKTAAELFQPSTLQLKLTYFLWTRAWSISSSKAGKLLRATLMLLADTVWYAPWWLGARLKTVRDKLAYRLNTSPGVAACLASVGYSPRILVGNFITQVPQQPEYRILFSNQNERIHNAFVVGIDLVPHQDGYYYLETNLNPALITDRTDLYTRDPFPEIICRHAADSGYERVVYVAGEGFGMSNSMADFFAKEATTAGVSLTVIEDPRIPSWRYKNLEHTHHRQGFKQSDYFQEDSTHERRLVVRCRPYDTSYHGLVKNKYSSYRALVAYQEATSDPDLTLIPSSFDPRELSLSDDPVAPNLVYKLPNLERSLGVYFLKVRPGENIEQFLLKALRDHPPKRFRDRCSRAFTDKNGIFQEYRTPLRLPDGRSYKIRCELLLSPQGVRYLSGRRVIGGYHPPKELPYGIVEDPRPFLMSHSAGGGYELMPEAEESKAQGSALAVGRGLQWALEKSFVTR